MIGNDISKNYRLPSPAEVICPGCKQRIRLVTYGQAMNVVCSSCAAILDSSDLTKKTGSFKKTAKPLIPIGSRGTVNNILYEVVGYSLCREYKTIYTWSEYVLFNPAYGYAFLSEFNGHWSYFHQTLIYPRNSAVKRFDLGPYEFNLFNDYKYNIDTACGEFFWPLKNEPSKIKEYICPPHILMEEISPDHIQWFKGEYLEIAEVKEAFHIKTTLPSRIGIGASQVMKGGSFDGIKKISLIALLILGLIQAMLSLFAAEEEIAIFQFEVPDSLRTKASYVSAPFQLKSRAGTSNLQLVLNADVDNGWFETAITLVNDDTGEEYYFEQGVEYYYGYTSGEHWTEGSLKDRKMLSSIPDGRYHLNITSYQDKSVRSFTIKVDRDVTIWTNFFLYLFLLMIYPAIQYFREHYFEYRRWENSNLYSY